MSALKATVSNTAANPHASVASVARDDHDDSHECCASGCASVYDPLNGGDQSTSSGAQGTALSHSESGTEADDERPLYGSAHALLSAPLRPRKGLKTGEINEESLLTPSQLDDEGRKKDYFRGGDRNRESSPDATAKLEEEQKLARRRRAEFLRRVSEVVLMTVILFCVLCGKGVPAVAYYWVWQLLAFAAIVVSLIVAYPIRLSLIDTARESKTALSQRFRVPASFDPATVLYPPLLPVLVSLSIAPIDGRLVLPNIILGLASMPQRLFPRSSRRGGFNTMHWMISIAPLIAAHTQGLTSSNDPGVETLATLYPLHHALLIPLQHLTTTSLLASELHLLSAVLIDLLLFADSPQATILKACLWIGGVFISLSCTAVLRWNMALARVPRWKLKRSGHAEKSYLDALWAMVKFPPTISISGSNEQDSDADEDDVLLTNSPGTRNYPRIIQEPRSAIEPRHPDPDSYFPVPGLGPRRNTLPSRPVLPPPKRRIKLSRSQWCLQLTAAQAERRKWTYAGYFYAAVAAIVYWPILSYVAEHAMQRKDPIVWALRYLFEDIPFIGSLIANMHLGEWLGFHDPGNQDWTQIRFTQLFRMPAVIQTFGPSNIRLALVMYWVLVLLTGLLTVFNLTAYVEVDTRRKVFHGVMVGILLPSLFIDPLFCSLALSLVLAAFLLLEVVRAGRVVPLGNMLSRFVAPYVDGRDLRGPVVVSHIFLLIGCAVPFWLSLASINRASDGDGWTLESEKREVAMVAGVVCVGMGDAAASLIGRRYGRHKWPWIGGKSLEGSAAFGVAVTLGLVVAKLWQVGGGWSDTTCSLAAFRGEDGLLAASFAWAETLFKAIVSACAASFMEAVLTGANDNVVVPVALWLLVKGLRI